MKVSFIIASVDRDSQLKSCIASVEKAHLYRQDIPVEILVVIQNAKQKKDILVDHPEVVRFYYIDKIGLSAARNFAIAKSAGDYCVFLDDDALVNEDFVDILAKETIKHKKVNAFCGRLIDPVLKAPFSLLFYNLKVKKIGRLDYQYFMGSAHVLNTSVLKAVGCYDERFGVGSKYFGSEETDLFFRLKAARQQVIYLPDLVFFHPIPIPPPAYVYNYAYAIGAMLTKNCFYDKFYFPAYIFMILLRITKAYIRLLQKKFFKGRYIEKDNKYHYASVLKGTFRGVRDFIKNEL